MDGERSTRWLDWADRPELRPVRPPVGKRESDVAPVAVSFGPAMPGPPMDRNDPRGDKNSRFRRTGTSTWRSPLTGMGVHPICSSSSSQVKAASGFSTSAFSLPRPWLMCSIGEATTFVYFSSSSSWNTRPNITSTSTRRASQAVVWTSTPTYIPYHYIDDERVRQGPGGRLDRRSRAQRRSTRTHRPAGVLGGTSR